MMTMGQEPLADEGKQPKPITRPLATSLAVAVGLTRLIPHPWNLSPAYAMELFSGARLRSWHAFAIPLAMRLVTDILLFPLHRPFLTELMLYFTAMPFVYLSIVVNVLIGRRLVRTESSLRIGCAAVLSSVQFFVITNFGVWLGSSVYPHTLTGLIACYSAGLLYYLPTLASCLLFSAVLFGAHSWLTRTMFAGERVPEPAT
jgi:hypothetical protein